MLKISNQVSISESNVKIQAIRAQGPGGQNVNKVSSAVHLRFDILSSDLPQVYKDKLLALNDQRITREGVIVIKAQTFRTLEKNKIDALERLISMIRQAVREPRKRKPTRPTRSSKQKRLDAKARHSKQKALRKKIDY
ncbi:MAG: aminoacyl-tRNA hydrolase [Desulfobacter sp.]|nr:aminoacyl-tRNA hydrolase [Desulfobacter sp.]WDP87739.1 MAG: aminoacyl-tRNA hydrolase [Desulfobacter sp.]